MRRREVISLIGGAALAWPAAARAQQPAVPVIGFLDVVNSPGRLAAFQQGLAESGYVLGQNVAIEIRSAEGVYSRFPELAADLVRRRVSVIVAPSATPAGSATTGISSSLTRTFSIHWR